MGKIAIRVENLGKRYQLGQVVSYKTLRESITNAMGALLQKKSVRPEVPRNDHIWALKNVSFQVEEGEVLGIIGRNGAGKTTLLRVLTRVTEPTEGGFEISGRVASLLEVGTGFHPELTGRENIYLNGAILGMKQKEIHRKFDEIVAFSGVEKFIDTPLKRYSSGMAVRLGFAVAAHLEPDILLMDEVLAVGDYEFQQKCFAKVRDVGTKGRTVLMVSHQLNSISSLCSRTILLDKGEIVKSGETSKVVEHYIATSRRVGGERIWDDPRTAPGNDKVRLHAIRILSSDGKVSADLDIHEEVLFQVSYWNLKEGASPNVSIGIRGAMDELVFWSLSRGPDSISPDMENESSGAVGLFQAECRFPANLFNTATYTIDLFMQFYMSQRELDVVERGVLSFTMHSLNKKGKPWIGYPGCVRPILPWRTKYLGGIKESTKQ